MHGDKELIEKLGRNDPCPCGSGLRFQAVLSGDGLLSMAPNAMIIGEIDPAGAGESQPRIRLRQHFGRSSAIIVCLKAPYVHNYASVWPVLSSATALPVDGGQK
ncbi:SEC-C metal-binding domain-containing protein [Sphingobium sp. LMC3-1-1.1]|uniref:SEC-C metal-binding domain-containing protein n=1 Tax=Sphingobium sp. LMC3-1-1.1 TaxID=3135241 RepID=UPI0034481956